MSERHRPRRRGRPPGPSPDQGQRREALLDAATTAVRQHGPHASMTDIAAAAGITKPILYRHFGDRAGLIAALGRRAGAELAVTLDAALLADVAPRDRMRAAIAAFVAFAEDAALYQFLVRSAREVEGEGDDLVAAIAAQIATVIGAGLRQVGADSGPAELWSRAIIGAVFAGSEWWQARRVMTRDQLVEDLTQLLWDGLGSTGLAAARGAGGSAPSP